MPRLFVAVRILPTDPVRTTLRSLADVRGVKAVAPEHLHYTLRFLGDVDDAAAAQAIDGFAAMPVRDARPLTVTMQGLGAFPRSDRPRVVWVGCDDAAAGRLASLAQDVDAFVTRLGLGPRDKPFAAHLTLARVKHLEGRGRAAIERLLQDHAASAFGEHTADGVHLVQSTLTPQGPVYQDVATRPLDQEGDP